ncbi:MAG: cyclic nucleotide-binding domain-containing protein [Burkholderiales bacterium]|nr:cyclic nucleotide-binding domain-containing protein [Burkholderiales bacterium]
MKGLPQDASDSELFASAFGDQGADPSLLVPWEARFVEVGAKPLAPSRAMDALITLWSTDKYMKRLAPGRLLLLAEYLEFVTVESDRDVIRQDEFGNFMIVLLRGTVAVDRLQPWGEHMRLAEARPGDVLGEMSLLDGGTRFSACTTLGECEFAVLRAEAMDGMMKDQPHLAAALVALLARKLSMRLRAVGARVSDRK